MSSIESNKEVVRKYVSAFNKGDVESLRDLFTADAQIYGVLGWGGLEQAEPVWRELHSAFAIELSIDEMIAEGDIVAVRYTERGKFVGAFRGKEPTSKPFEVVAMEWFVFRDGKIHRRWGARDHASQQRQMGM